MEEHLSDFTREVVETKKRVLSERDSKKIESMTQKLKEMKTVNPEEVQRLIREGQDKIRTAAANGRNEAIVLTFHDKDVVKPPDQVSWCLPRPEWIRANFQSVFRFFEIHKLKPRIEDWIEQKTGLQGYAVWVQIP